MRGTWADAGFTENSHWLLVYHIFHRNTVWTFSEILESCSSFWVWFLRNHFHFSESFSITQQVKDSPAMQETWVQSLGWEDPLEMGTPTHYSILDWRIPWTEEAGRLQSMGSQRVCTLWATFIFIQYLLYLPNYSSLNIGSIFSFFLSFFFTFFFFFCPPEHSDILQTKIPMEKCCFFLPRIILFTLVLWLNPDCWKQTTASPDRITVRWSFKDVI